MAATITGAVFDDLNHNGIRDPGEPGIPAAYVTLYGPAGCAGAQTDGSGGYSFSVTVPGSYSVYETGGSPGGSCPPTQFSQPPGYSQSNSPRRLDLTVSNFDIAGNTLFSGLDFAHDAQAAPLPCGPDMIRFTGRPSQWSDTNLVTGQSAPRGPLTPDHAVDAVGYHPFDNHLYGYDQTVNAIVRIDDAGLLATLPLPAGLPAAAYNVGTVDMNGVLYLYATGADRFYAVDLRQDSPTYLRLVDPTQGFAEQTGPYGVPLSAPADIGDWAADPRDGELYGVARDGTVLRISPYSGLVQPLETTGPSPGSPFGAVVIDQSGSLYAVSNADGTIYRYTHDGFSARGARFSTAEANEFQDAALCPFALIETDFGDAPDAGGGGGSGNYNTLLSSNGPRHALGRPLYLGSLVTAEPDAHVNATATGDDLTQGIPDDGLAVPLPPLSISAADYTLNVTVLNQTGQDAYLYGWVDFNKNGLFEEDEADVRQVPSSGGLQTVQLTFAVPPGTVLLPGHTFVRLRLTTDLLDPGADPAQDGRSVGPASDGEVEDYLLDLLAEADLDILKTGDPPTLSTGELMTYTITITNAGPDPAQDVLLTDEVPPELAQPEYSLDGGATWLPWTGALGLGTLPPGQVVNVLIRGQFTGSTAPSLINTATVTTTSDDPNPGNNSSTVITPIVSSADLEIAKRAEPTPVLRGQPIFYTLTVRNLGPDGAANVLVQDPLSAYLLQPEFSLDGGFSWLPWLGQYEYPELPAGTAAELLIRAIVAEEAPDELINSAQVTSPTPDPDPANNEVELVTPVESLADLSLYKMAFPDPVAQGQELTFTLVVSNAGPSLARDVTVTDALPAELQNPEFSLDGGGSWQPWTDAAGLGDLPPGAVFEVLIRGKVDPFFAGPLFNSAEVTSPTPDPDYGNNTGAIVVTVEPSADIQVTKTPDLPSVYAGEVLTYTVTVTNAGPGQAQDVKLSDPLPAGLTRPEYSLDGGATWQAWPGAITLGNMADGDALTVLIRGLVEAAQEGRLVNTAVATSVTYDPNPDNNSDTAVTPATLSANLSVRKSANPDPVTAGGELLYTVDVLNAGPSAAADVILDDAVPAELQNPQYSLDGGGSWLPWTGALDLGVLAANSALQALIRGTVAPSASGALTNTATVSSSVPDPDPSDNSHVIDTPVGASADLSLIKLASPSPAVPGQEIAYTLIAANAGPSDAPDATVTDAVSPGLLNPEYSLDNGAAWSPWPGSIDLGALAAGQAVTLLVRGVADPSATGALTNTATVSSSVPDPNPDNNTDTVDTPLAPSADLSLTKTGSPDPVLGGQLLTYTIDVLNAGPSYSQGVVLTDPLPAGLTGQEYSLDGGATWLPWTGSLDLGGLAPGAASAVLIRGQAPVGQSGLLTNTATVTATTPDPDPGNNSDTALIGLGGAADLSVTKTAAPSPVPVGDELTYTIDVANAGPDPADSVTLSDPTPAGLLIPEYSLDGGATWLPWTGSLDLGTLAPGAASAVLIRGQAGAPSLSELVNTATVSSTTPDPNPDNNSSTAVTPVGSAADLRLSKTAAPDPAIPGQTLTYTLTALNQGPDAAQAVTLSDPTPAGLLIPEYSLDGGATWLPWTGSLALGDLAPGAASTALLRGQASPSAAGSLENTATVSSPTPDPNPDDNTATVETPLTPSADLAVSKSAAPDPALPGQELVYTVIVANQGPSDAQAVTLADALPAVLSGGEYSLDGGAAWSPWTGRLSLGALGAGQSATLLIRGTLTPSALGSLVNTAVASSPTPDPNPDNNSSTIETPVEPYADLSVVKTASPNPAVPGQELTYTLLVSNAGPAASQGVTLTDATPAGLQSPEYSLDGGGWLPWTGSLDLGGLPRGQERTVRLRGQVASGATGPLTNTAAVNGTTTDPNPVNNSSTVQTPLVPSANLHVQKTADRATVSPGERLTYTILVENRGPAVAQAVTLTDLTPASLQFPEYSLDGGVTWSPWFSPYVTGPLAPSGIFLLQLRGLVSPAATGPVANTASVTSPTPDPDPGDNSDTVITPIAPSAGLSVTKSASPSPAVPGQPLTYTVTVRNAGPSDATGLVLVDALPSPLRLPEYSLDNGFTWRPWTGSLALGGLAAGAASTVLIRGALSAMATGALSNTAVVTSATPDPDLGDNSYTDVTPVQPLANLRVAKRASPSPAVPGQTLTYTLLATNAGPATALAVTLTDQLPAGLQSPQFSLDGGATWQPWTGSLSLGDIPAGRTVPVLLRAQLAQTAAGALRNTATVSSSVPDPDPDDNTVTVETPVAGAVDLRLSKTASPNPAVPGQPLVYTLTVYNGGPNQAERVTLTDATPGAQYSLDGGAAWQPWTGSLDLGALAAGQSLTVLLRAPVSELSSGSLSNTATVTAATPDPNPDDNTVTIVTPIAPAADLTVFKTTSPNPALPGQPVIHTLVVYNKGPLQAEDVVLTDDVSGEYSLDGGATWIDWPGSYAIGSLPAGAQARVLIRTPVDEGAYGELRNTATVSGSVYDPHPEDNSSTAVTPILGRADLRITKAAQGPAVPGGALVYRITVENAGPSYAADVAIADAVSGDYSLDNGATWQPWTGSYSVGLLPAGDSASLLLRVAVPAEATELANTALVTASTPDPNPDDNRVTIVTPVQVSADLRLCKYACPQSAAPCQPLVYTLEVLNAGPSAAQDTVVADALPAGLQGPQFSLDNGATWSPWTGSHRLGVIPSGASARLLIRGTVDPCAAGGCLVNTARVSSPTPDPDLRNNTGTVSTPVC